MNVSAQDLATLRSWSRSAVIEAALAERARIVACAAEGLANAQIAERLGVSRPTVILWRGRYAEGGIDALADRHRSGRPREIDQHMRLDIVARTLAGPPKRLGVTHWSTRLLASQVGVSNFTVSKIWREYGLKPHRTQTFKFSTDPELVEKIRDIVGLYLNPPEHAVVLCIDEKSQIQALDRTQPILPLRPGLAERRTHDYLRHGTATLFAALEVATGKVTEECFERHRHQEFLRFLKRVAKAYPRGHLHIVLDNYGTHTHPVVNAWLERHPRIHLHFTPTGASWLNMVEIFFGIITKQAIRRGQLRTRQRAGSGDPPIIDPWNERCEPFVWTKGAYELITRTMRKKTSPTRH
ncbi:MAG: IS630 family transposase [Actinomycetota bacterium]|nr:IS630 family transposase [Actinomycetota bacterium]